FPTAIPSLPLTSISQVIGPGGTAVLGPVSVAPVSPANGVATTWRLTFPDQNPGTTAIDLLPAGTYTVKFTATPVVLGPTAVAQVNPVNGMASTWRLTFPDQDPTTPANDLLPAGTYTVEFTTGAKLDINWNAGLDVLKGGSLT